MARIARERPLRDEAVTEGAGALVREDAGLALPTQPVRGVEGVDVQVPAVLVRGHAFRIRPEPVHRRLEVAIAAEHALPPTVVRPIRMGFEHGQRARPVGDVELPVRVLRKPGIEAEKREERVEENRG